MGCVSHSYYGDMAQQEDDDDEAAPPPNDMNSDEMMDLQREFEDRPDSSVDYEKWRNEFEASPDRQAEEQGGDVAAALAAQTADGGHRVGTGQVGMYAYSAQQPQQLGGVPTRPLPRPGADGADGGASLASAWPCTCMLTAAAATERPARTPPRPPAANLRRLDTSSIGSKPLPRPPSESVSLLHVNNPCGSELSYATVGLPACCTTGVGEGSAYCSLRVRG